MTIRIAYHDGFDDRDGMDRHPEPDSFEFELAPYFRTVEIKTTQTETTTYNVTTGETVSTKTEE